MCHLFLLPSSYYDGMTIIPSLYQKGKQMQVAACSAAQRLCAGPEDEEVQRSLAADCAADPERCASYPRKEIPQEEDASANGHPGRA